MATLRHDTSDDWYFDEDEAQRAAAFFPEMLCHVKGTAGPFDLEPWQKTLVTTVFGWKSTQTGLRRYRQVYCEVPRKNGKTTLAAGIMLYMLLVDKEPGAEVYSAATTRAQAGLIYEIAAGMIAQNPMLSKRCKRLKSKKRLIAGDSYFQACSSQAGASQGTNPHCVVFDELHEQPNRVLWDVFQTGFGARAQPLFLSITTAGFDRSSVCWEQHEYARSIEQNPEMDETFFPLIYGADDDDDWTDERTWEKANPCLDVSLKRDYLRAECIKSKEMPALENTFRRLHLNQWTEQETRFVPMRQWDACGEINFTESDMVGRPCFAAMDLASTRDVTALVLVFPDSEGGYFVLPWFWIPRDNIDARAGQDRRLVLSYAKNGYLRCTDGNVIDYQRLCRDVYEIIQRFDCQHVGFDPWQSDSIVQKLESMGVPNHVMQKVSQTTSTFNEPMKRLVSLLSEKKLKHGNNPVLRWMASNMVAREDANGNYRPDKSKSQDKIDGMTALLTALRLAFDHEHTSSAYETDGGGVILL